MLHILTLHWNAVSKIDRLYESLIDVVKGVPFKWWIKDNGSADGSEEFFTSIQNDHIDILYSGHNRDSFAVGMNILFERANPKDDDLILLLNNDLWFGDDSSLKKMIALLKDDVGMVGARILYPDSNLLQHAGVYFSKKYNYMPYHYKHKEPTCPEVEMNREVEAVTAAIALTKAEYYKNITTNNKSGRKGLDECYFWAFEDISACLSIKYNLNKKIMYCGDTLIYHEESASLKRNPVNKMLMPQNVKRFKEQWSGKYKKYD